MMMESESTATGQPSNGDEGTADRGMQIACGVRLSCQ